MARKHKMDEVLKSLHRKKDLSIDSQGNVIYLLKEPKNNDLGNSSWGKIDFLKKYCGYNIIEVDQLPNEKKKETYRRLKEQLINEQILKELEESANEKNKIIKNKSKKYDKIGINRNSN